MRCGPLIPRRLNSDEKNDLATMLRSLALLATPIPAQRLATLIGILPRRAVLLNDLSSVLHIPSNNAEPVTIIHKSFSDFLLRQSGTGNDCLRVNATETHAMLASRCLELMLTPQDKLSNELHMGVLKRDICNLQDCGKLRDDLDKAAIVEAIPPDLEYACLNWVYHLELCLEHASPRTEWKWIAQKNSEFLVYLMAILIWLLSLPWSGEQSQEEKNRQDELSPEMIDGLLHNADSFLKLHFLHWLEALGLVGRVPDGAHIMASLCRVLKVSYPKICLN
jgi:hypothetical protein